MVKHTQNIKEAARVLQQGRVVAFPTGTSYGLAVDALQGHALQRVRNIKQRPQEKIFSIFMKESLWPEFLDLSDTEKEFLAQHKNQPLTLLVEAQPDLSHLMQDGRVALRVIDHPLMLALAEAVDVPLTATSANISGQEACYSPTEIEKAFPGKLDETTYDLSLGLILDAGELPHKQASTIVKIQENKIIVVREGAIKTFPSFPLQRAGGIT